MVDGQEDGRGARDRWNAQGHGGSCQARLCFFFFLYHRSPGRFPHVHEVWVLEESSRNFVETSFGVIWLARVSGNDG